MVITEKVSESQDTRTREKEGFRNKIFKKTENYTVTVTTTETSLWKFKINENKLSGKEYDPEEKEKLRPTYPTITGGAGTGNISEFLDSYSSYSKNYDEDHEKLYYDKDGKHKAEFPVKKEKGDINSYFELQENFTEEVETENIFASFGKKVKDLLMTGLSTQDVIEAFE
jgi:hypothetical protein